MIIASYDNNMICPHSRVPKAFVAIVLLLSTFVFCAACGKISLNNGNNSMLPDDTANYVKDYEPTYSALMQTMFETESSIYVLSEGTVWFTDKTYKDWMPLCGKPNCDHETDDCNAKIPAIESQSGIYLYGNHIWYVDESHGEFDDSYIPKLCRMRLNGSNHEVVCELPVPEASFSPIGSRWKFNLHRNFLIVNYSAQKNPAGSSVWEYSVSYLFNLNDLTVTYVIPDESIPANIDASICEAPLCSQGELLFSYIYKIDRTSGKRENWLASVDCKDGKASLVCELPSNTISVFDRVACFKDGKLLLCTFDPSTLYRWIYSIDINTGICSLVAEAAFGDAYWGTLDNISGYSFAFITSGKVDSSEHGFAAYDLELTRLLFLPISEFPKDASKLHLDFITEDYIFFAADSKTASLSHYTTVPLYYIEKSDLLSETPKVKIWEP